MSYSIQENSIPHRYHTVKSVKKHITYIETAESGLSASPAARKDRDSLLSDACLAEPRRFEKRAYRDIIQSKMNSPRFGRYEILDELGRGSMGVVYRARDPMIDREVAIKTVPVGYEGDSRRRANHLERLRREALAAGRLNHPNIVVIHDVGEEGDSFYIAMELLRGKTLDRHIKEGGKIGPEWAAGVIAATADALDHAHSKQVVHRDIKPSNLFLTDSDVLKITDFGIAKLPLGTITAEGRIVGSPSYMSPEQVRGRPVDGRSDIFSLAIVTYILLTGKKPFGAGEVPDIVYRIVHEDPPPVTRLRPDLPVEINPVMEKALAKDASKRYDSAGEFARALKKALASAGMKEASEPEEENTSDSTSEGRRMPFDMDRYREKSGGGISQIDRVFHEITSEVRSFTLKGHKKKRKKRKY